MCKNAQRKCPEKRAMCLKDLDVESHVISSLEIGPILKFSFQLRIMPALKLMASSLHNKSLTINVSTSESFLLNKNFQTGF